MRAKVLCSGWLKPVIIELTEKQLEDYQNNPVCLSVEVLPSASGLKYSDDWTEKDDQELKDRNECGWDDLCTMCKEFSNCSNAD
jgi:hypothetical protein